jgi:hypothetical protein
LAGTACVLAGLGLLAIPLRKLTSAAPAPAAPATRTVASPGAIPAVLRLRLLAPASRLVVTTAAGEILLDKRDLSPGESEHDAMIAVGDGGLDLTLQADFDGSGPETAAFLTVMPDGYEDQTRYVIGTGRIKEPLRYEWRTH